MPIKKGLNGPSRQPQRWVKISQIHEAKNWEVPFRKFIVAHAGHDRAGYKTSLLDPQEESGFRGSSIPELQQKLPHGFHMRRAPAGKGLFVSDAEGGNAGREVCAGTNGATGSAQPCSQLMYFDAQ